MSELVKPMAEWCAAIIEALGIGLITATALYVLCFAAFQVIKRAEAETIFRHIRQRLGHGILFGLSFSLPLTSFTDSSKLLNLP